MVKNINKYLMMRGGQSLRKRDMSRDCEEVQSSRTCIAALLSRLQMAQKAFCGPPFSRWDRGIEVFWRPSFRKKYE